MRLLLFVAGTATYRSPCRSVRRSVCHTLLFFSCILVTLLRGRSVCSYVRPSIVTKENPPKTAIWNIINLVAMCWSMRDVSIFPSGLVVSFSRFEKGFFVLLRVARKREWRRKGRRRNEWNRVNKRKRLPRKVVMSSLREESSFLEHRRRQFCWSSRMFYSSNFTLRSSLLTCSFIFIAFRYTMDTAILHQRPTK